MGQRVKGQKGHRETSTSLPLNPDILIPWSRDKSRDRSSLPIEPNLLSRSSGIKNRNSSVTSAFVKLFDIRGEKNWTDKNQRQSIDFRFGQTLIRSRDRKFWGSTEPLCVNPIDRCEICGLTRNSVQRHTFLWSLDRQDLDPDPNLDLEWRHDR